MFNMYAVGLSVFFYTYIFCIAHWQAYTECVKSDFLTLLLHVTYKPLLQETFKSDISNVCDGLDFTGVEQLTDQVINTMKVTRIIFIYLFIYCHLYSAFSIVQCSNALYRLWDGEIQGHTGQPSVREIDAHTMYNSMSNRSWPKPQLS